MTNEECKILTGKQNNGAFIKSFVFIQSLILSLRKSWTRPCPVVERKGLDISNDIPENHF